jgi:4-hydroxybenzoate polyprenyltransferase
MVTEISNRKSSVSLLQPFATLMKCLEEARPAVLGIFLLRFIVATMVSTGRVSLAHTILGCVTWEAAILYVYLFNGVMDVREDRINQSGRPIARGVLPRETAARVSAGAMTVALTGAAALGPATLCVVIVAIAVGWQYSAAPLCLKRRPIGAPAACLVLGLTTYAASFFTQAGTTQPDRWPEVLLFAFVMSAWMGLVGAPAKDLSDTRGDAAAGRRTLAVLRGETDTRRLVAMCALGLAAVFVCAAVVLAPALRWPSLILLAGALGVAAVSLTRLSQGGRSRQRLPYRVFMATQYAVHIGAVAVLIR